ncbi:serine/threonine protein kinase [Parabacteroides pacaensis]|uniref:serine/threonine protein kinase n=1 Tax=Parabacteroides pacaensis TaxID=2086575 RepID=UPI000D10BFE6|nr:serine/threonine-protein kinase [Parabacteroides pacaensis]
MLIRKLQGQLEKQNGIYYEYDADVTPIGEGGMGVVYYGFRVDERTGARTEVAIKALHDDLPEEVYARAEREASIQLRHDNLVEMLGLISIFETNRWGESIYHHYVISEFLHGIELSDLLVGRFNNKANEDNTFARELYNNYLINRESTSLEIIRHILSGVLALHDKGYIHRDIDPSNIMVTNDGCIKLIDFGIAKNLKSLGSRDKLMTAAGKFIGKAEYASPELVLGDVRNQNYTTDIYALGILLYRLLVGKLPFDGSQYEVLQQQLKHKVPVKFIQNKALAKVVKKASEKIQNRRYGSIAEFRVAIDAAANYKPTLWDTFGRYTIVACIFIMIGIGVWTYLNNESQPAPIAPTQRDRYNSALSLLNSNITDSVKLGFEKMTALAEEDYDSAKIEVGITYFAGTKSDLILQRRKNLGLNSSSINPLELVKTIKYISSVKDESVLTPEIHYILGSAYYSTDNQNIIPVISSFKIALDSLDAGKEASHGYDSKKLQEVLKYNIEQLKE